MRALLIAVAILPVALLGTVAWLNWRQAWTEARTEILHATEAGAEYVRRVLGDHDQAVRRINDLLRGLSDDQIRAREAELHAVLRERVREVPEVSTAYVLDRAGTPLLSASVFPLPRDASVSDREHHALLAAPGAPDVVVTRVYVGRIEGNVFFAVARRRQETGNRGLPPGTFDGSINVSVDPAVLAGRLQRVLGQSGDAVGLVRNDGEVLARSLDGQRTLPAPRLPPQSAAVQAMQRGEEVRVSLLPSLVDGVERLGVIRRVEGWPVYVTAARASTAIT
ncbi:MAG TPA: hypothetical protein VD970_16050, partial [Acetobacteraceae bacterium]|nr:hypothetical protein [Acetobacteraceae bacterium]